MQRRLTRFVIAVASVLAAGTSAPGQDAWAGSVSMPWIRQLGTPLHDSGSSIATDSSGLYVTGHTAGSLGGNPNAGDHDLFLVKYDASGAKLWTRQYGTSSSDAGRGVATGPGGSVYVTGTTRGGLDGNVNAGGIDLFLMRFDASGNKLWTRQLGTALDDMAEGVSTDSSGNVYVTGITDGGLDGNANLGSFDVFLVKYDANGNKLWTRQVGTATSDGAYDLATDSQGNVYVTGFTTAGLGGNLHAGLEDAFVIKVDANGNALWFRQLGTASSDFGFDVATDASGNAVVTGATNGSLDGNPNAGGYDIFVTKYGASGSKLWTRQIGTATPDFGHGVAVDGLGNAHVTGYASAGLDWNLPLGKADVVVVAYDPLGIKLTSRQSGSGEDDKGADIAVDPDNNVYVVGWTEGSLPGNTSAGGSDAFTSRL